MTRAEIEQQVRSVLRESKFATRDLVVGLSDPLADLGLLDSLALVEFVTAVEVRFQIELPGSIWSSRHELTLEKIIEAVSQSRANGANVATAPVVAAEPAPSASEGGSAPSTSETVDSKVLKVGHAIRERGWVRGAAWILVRLAGWVKRLLYVQENQLLLEFDLQGGSIPCHSSSLDLIIRDATVDDVPELCQFFASFDRGMSERTLQHRLQHGFTCFVAVHDAHIVGMTWISNDGEDNCPFTGLDFKMLPTSCYALDLYERESYGGKGVGLALLSHALVAAKTRGFHKQVTTVDVTNTKMLTAAIHMTGFVTVGTIRTNWILRRPMSSWKIGERKGRGRAVVR